MTGIRPLTASELAELKDEQRRRNSLSEIPVGAPTLSSFDSPPEKGFLARAYDTYRNGRKTLEAMVFPKNSWLPGDLTSPQERQQINEQLKIGYSKLFDGTKDGYLGPAYLDISQAFAKSDFTENAKQVGTNVWDALTTGWGDPIEKGKRAASGLLGIGESLVGDVVSMGRLALPIQYDENGVAQALTQKEAIDIWKRANGFAAASVVTMGMTTAIQGAVTQVQAARAGALTAGKAVDVLDDALLMKAAQVPGMGRVGTTVLADVLAGAGGGMTQGTIANANTEDAFAGALNGLIFAPVGAAFGYLRGRGLVNKGDFTPSEALRHEANQVRNWRTFTALNDSPASTIGTTAQVLMKSDDIAEAVIRGTVDPENGRHVNKTYGVSETTVAKLNTEGLLDRAWLRKLDDGTYEVANFGESVDPLIYKDPLLKARFMREGKLPSVVTLTPGGFVEGQYRKIMQMFADDPEMAGLSTDEKMLEASMYMQAEVKGKRFLVGDEAPDGTFTVVDPLTKEKLPGVAKSDLVEAAGELYKVRYNKTKFMDALFQRFMVDRDGTKSWDKQIAGFIVKNKLEPFSRHIAHAFDQFASEQYANMPEFTELRDVSNGALKLISEILEHERTETQVSIGNLTNASTRAGLNIRELNGDLVISDLDGNDLGRAKSLPEAMDYVKKAGVPAHELNSLNLDADHPLPPSLRGVGPLMPEMPHQLNPTSADVYGKGLRGKWLDFWNAFDLNNQDWSTAEAKLIAIDETAGTSFKNLFGVLKNETINMHKMIGDFDADPRVQRIKYLHGKLGNQASREAVTSLMQAATVDELMAPNGLLDGMTLHPDAKNVAQWFNENNIDPRRVLVYRRNLLEAELKAVQLIADKTLTSVQKAQGEIVRAMHAGATQSGPAALEAQIKVLLDAGGEELKNYKNHPIYKSNIATINSQYPVTDPAFQHGLNLVQDLFYREAQGAQYTGGANVLGMTELYDRIKTPEINKSFDDYATHFKMTSEQLALAKELRKYYDTEYVARDIGQKSAFISRYVPHMRTLGIDLSDSNLASQFGGSVLSESTKNFLSMMDRIGELDNYVRDPLQTIQLWNRAYAKYKTVYKVMPDVYKSVESVRGIVKDASHMEAAKNILEDFSDRLIGRPPRTTKLVHDTKVRQWLNRGLGREEIVDRIQGADPATIITNYMNANILGLRPDQAIRDFIDAQSRYYIFFEGKRSATFAKHFIEMSTGKSAIFDRLREAGIVRPADYVNMYNPTSAVDPRFTLGDVKAKAANVVKDMAEVAFKTSLQGPVYERIQAAAYHESFYTAHDAVGKYIRNELTVGELRRAVGLARYDIPTQQRFLELAKTKHLQASDYLARETAHIMSGGFVQGNIQMPQGAIGKMFGQLASYSIANRSIMTKAMARSEDAFDAVKLNTRMLGVETLKAGIGAATGINMSRYANIPVLSYIVGGGPLLNAAQGLTSAALAYGWSGGNDAQAKRAANELASYVNAVTPFGYGIQTGLDAYKELDKGHVGHAVTRAVFGLKPAQADIKKRNMWEEMSRALK